MCFFLCGQRKTKKKLRKLFVFCTERDRQTEKERKRETDRKRGRQRETERDKENEGQSEPVELPFTEYSFGSVGLALAPNAQLHVRVRGAASVGRFQSDGVRESDVQHADVHKVSSNGEGALELAKWARDSDDIAEWLKSVGVKPQEGHEHDDHEDTPHEYD